MGELLDLLPVVGCLLLGALVIWSAEHLPRWADELDRRMVERRVARHKALARSIIPGGILVNDEPLTAERLAVFRRAWHEALGRALEEKLDAMHRQNWHEGGQKPAMREQFISRLGVPRGILAPAQCTATSLDHQHRCPNPAVLDGLCRDCNRVYCAREITGMSSGALPSGESYHSIQWEQN